MPMDSKTYITLDLQAPNVAVVAAGKQNDRASRKIVAQLRDGETLWTPPTGVAAMIRYAKPDGTAGFYDVLEDGSAAYSISDSVITFTLVEQALTVPGNVWVEINFYTETEKLTTFYFLLEVQRSVLEDATIISSDYYNVLSAQIQALLGATANPPKIDPNTKNWLLWDEDTGAYVDSGFSSVGTTGPQGPQGVGISTVTKASGTGAPGTTDVYNVNKTDGTVAGQFDVYNGSDGQGSPGSQTPLVDSGAGSVGSATAYSREDHQHPYPAIVHVGSSEPTDPDIDIWLDTDEPGQTVVTSLNGMSGPVSLSGELRVGTNATSLVVPTATYTTLSTVDLDEGVWIITAGHEWSSSFTQITVDQLFNVDSGSGLPGTTIRFTGEGGGGTNLAVLINVTSAMTIGLRAYQASGSNKTASSVVLLAYKLV